MTTFMDIPDSVITNAQSLANQTGEAQDILSIGPQYYAQPLRGREAPEGFIGFVIPDFPKRA